MSKIDITAVCAQCGYGFNDPSIHEPCPMCGSTTRNVSVTTSDTVELHEGLALEANRPGWKGFIRRYISRTKLSLTGKKAKEVLDINRSSLEKTTKYHRVEEFDKGEWRTVHEHQEEHEAKRRPPSNEQ